jgi:hypothetical protein
MSSYSFKQPYRWKGGYAQNVRKITEKEVYVQTTEKESQFKKPYVYPADHVTSERTWSTSDFSFYGWPAWELPKRQYQTIGGMVTQTLTLRPLASANDGWFSNLPGGIYAASVENIGSGYLLNDELTLSNGTGIGTGATVRISNIIGTIATVSIGDQAGAYYTVNEIVTLDSGNSDGKVKILTVGAPNDHVDSIALDTPGTGYCVEQTTVTSNLYGVDLWVRIDSVNATLMQLGIVTQGTEYDLDEIYTTTGGNGTDCTIRITSVDNYFISDYHYLTFGNRYIY